ncbi:glycogenin glucosyltransferase [Sorochytrium milnesiophthora]
MPASNSAAFATLVMTEQYVAGALVLANSLRAHGSQYARVVMHSTDISEPALDQLRTCFDVLFPVDTIRSADQANLQLLGRPDLGATYSKLHVWRLTSYEKVVFMDADTLVLHNVDDLFEREELSAAPDCGWPDIFNSGVFVLRPSQETFERLVAFAQQRGSWDGADQGLLNDFFSSWNETPGRRLPFVYNVTPTTVYTYAPAFERFKDGIKVVHFAGPDKPWRWARFSDGTPMPKGNHSGTMLNLVAQWWAVHNQHASSWGAGSKAQGRDGAHNHAGGAYSGHQQNQSSSSGGGGSGGYNSGPYVPMHELSASRYQWPEHEFGHKKPKSLKLYESNVLGTSTDDATEAAERMRAIKLRNGPMTPTTPSGPLGDNFSTGGSIKSASSSSSSPSPLSASSASGASLPVSSNQSSTTTAQQQPARSANQQPKPEAKPEQQQLPPAYTANIGAEQKAPPAAAAAVPKKEKANTASHATQEKLDTVTKATTSPQNASNWLSRNSALVVGVSSFVWGLLALVILYKISSFGGGSTARILANDL